MAPKQAPDIGVALEGVVERAVATAIAPFVSQVRQLEQSLRACHERIAFLEDRYAELAPGKSSGSPSDEFRSPARVDPEDGRAMREEFRRGVPEHEITQRWKQKKQYTSRQVASALAHAKGALRRRSHDHEHVRP